MGLEVTGTKEALLRALTITVERSLEILTSYTEVWQDLVVHAADPNPFYEPYTLLAALRLLPQGENVEMVLVWVRNSEPGQPAVLVGLFPLVRHARYKGLPLTALGTWTHLYSYLGTPLVRTGYMVEVLDAFFTWLRDDPGSSLFVWDTIASDTAFYRALKVMLKRRALGAFRDKCHTRALFRPAESAEGYLNTAVPAKKQKELRRQLRRIGEIDTLIVTELPAHADPNSWIDQFLALEANGWKGRAGTAMKNDPAARALFHAYIVGAQASGRLMAFTMAFPQAALPIAMKCNLRAGDGAIAFKITYDEEFAKHSPGVLLEVEHLSRLHQPDAPRWIDSGAAADHPMINSLWRDRTGIETLVSSTGGRIGVLVVTVLSCARVVRDRIFGRRVRSIERAP